MSLCVGPCCAFHCGALPGRFGGALHLFIPRYWDEEMITYEEHVENTSCCSVMMSFILSIASFLLGCFCLCVAETWGWKSKMLRKNKAF